VKIHQYHIRAGDHALGGDVEEVEQSIGRTFAAADRITIQMCFSNPA
jgi:hypothetical protein